MSKFSIIGIACLVLALVLIAVNMEMAKRQKRGVRQLNRSKAGNFAVFLMLYNRISSIPLLRQLMFSIRKRLEINTVSDEKTIRKRAVLLVLTTVFFSLSIIMIFRLIVKDLFMMVLLMVLLVFTGDTAIELFINNLQNRLLKQLVRYLELLRHKYYEQKSVEDANLEACNLLNGRGTFEAYMQAERINDILTSKDAEEELEKYYETAPNKYFKMLAGIIYITKEYGDTLVENDSVFIRCIAYLACEIKAEIYKREKLKYALKSLNTVSLMPMFFLKPLRNWASQSFMPLERFYSSKIGIILGIATIMASIISYMTLRKLQRFDRPFNAGYIKKNLEQRLYDKFMHLIVDRLIPKGYTARKNYLLELIKNALAPLDLKTLYTRRLIAGVMSFVFGICLFIGLIGYTRHVILYRPQMPEGYLGGRLSDEEYEKLQAITDMDREIILRLGKNSGKEAILEELIKDGTLSTQEAEAAAERIGEKMRKLSENIFWWWQLLICLILFILGYNAPIISLRFMANARKIDMEDEVSQFQTIILMLMHMNRVHVQEILEWMEAFSLHFKIPLQKCIQNFSSGPYEALEQLKTEVAFPPLLLIIDNLQLACENLDVAKAFEELESEMSFSRETRKESNERIVERKKNLGNMIGFMPVYALIVLYLIIPMIVSGMESISAFYRQLMQI
ncbi:MAG TPA: hypothetical protein GXX26_02490 [Clostridiaceae bacterium]|nr:hypothetical protein [Clostridiaceae bacterium]